MPLTRESLHTEISDAQPEDEQPIQDSTARYREELRMLMLGFGTGILIAFIFLIYIVLAFSGVLP
jgi:hypothetical protein